MKIDAAQHGRVMVLKITGRMDLENIKILDDHVQDLVKRGTKNVILQLIDVQDVSSTGLQRVLHLKQVLEAKSGRLALCDLSAVFEYVLDLAQLTAEFSVFPNLPAALTAFGRDAVDSDPGQF